MSVRVVARIRPLLKHEQAKDTILTSVTNPENAVVRLPNPRNEAESYSFQFNGVYDQAATQQQLFDEEIAPAVKGLYRGLDVTLFAYGSTGTGKTHTMRGGKSLADRGVIPRALSAIYRRARRIEKDSGGAATVDVRMSYYEIYCDKVYDLFEAPDKRTAAGLPIRDNGGKTVVVGLTERPCESLKEFESMYDQANINRSTSATKLNAHSSRSHAILSVRLTQTSGEQVLTSTLSAIDLAGSEDNRRTENGKDRMVESAAINKSLFVLAQCVEAISRKQARIPYRESRMTRILSLGQNNGITIMILNLAPVRSCHLDTLGSLNFANRTKKIEVNPVENQPVMRVSNKGEGFGLGGTAMQRQPLRPKNFSTNIVAKESTEKMEKPIKSFTVFAEKPKPSMARMDGVVSRKRISSENQSSIARPSKMLRTSDGAHPQLTGLTAASIEALIDRKVSEKLADAALHAAPAPTNSQQLSREVQDRLDALERRVETRETGRSEGLQYLLMAKQHQVRGEHSSALKMYRLALPWFPDNEKLNRKMLGLEAKMAGDPTSTSPARIAVHADDGDASFHEDAAGDSDDDDAEDSFLPLRKAGRRRKLAVCNDLPGPLGDTPRSKELLRILNSRDVAQIRLLKGIGAKRAEMIVASLCDGGDGARWTVADLGRLRGVGSKGLERMREGLVGGA